MTKILAKVSIIGSANRNTSTEPNAICMKESLYTPFSFILVRPVTGSTTVYRARASACISCVGREEGRDGEMEGEGEMRASGRGNERDAGRGREGHERRCERVVCVGGFSVQDASRAIQ